MPYLLDSNVFIQAKRLHYGMDFCPAFWDWLDEQNREGIVFSIEKVAEELQAGDDELSEWAEKHDHRFFLAPDQQMLTSLTAVSQWVQSQSYRSAAVQAFFQDADYYLVAHALAHNHVVVTHEVPSDGVKQVKIPNVCIGVNVRFMNPFAMLRVEKAKFVLGERRRES